jgi:hypothetical protein
MEQILLWVSKQPWSLIIVLCLTLGLAPFNPPHLWQKLQMLHRDELKKPLDWFDLFLHGSPWIVLILKVYLSLSRN